MGLIEERFEKVPKGMKTNAKNNGDSEKYGIKNEYRCLSKECHWSEYYCTPTNSDVIICKFEISK